MPAYLYIVVAILAALNNIAQSDIDVNGVDFVIQLKQLAKKITKFNNENNHWIKRLAVLQNVIEETKIEKEEVLSRKRRNVDPEMGSFVGKPGAPGLPGSSGIPGAMGRRGVKGLKGIAGAPGLRGPPGPFGPPGWMGQPGFQGTIGIKGEKGQPGFDGVPGLIGDVGYVGFTGQPGHQGPPGFFGHPGFIGMIGMPGPKGDPGFTGVPGVPGMQGPIGLPGPVGVYGSAGEMGELGFIGPRGTPGPMGATGDIGDQGEHGDWGLTGAPGPIYDPYAGFLQAPMLADIGKGDLQGSTGVANCSKANGKEGTANCTDLPIMMMTGKRPAFRHPPPGAHVMAPQSENGSLLAPSVLAAPAGWAYDSGLVYAPPVYSKSYMGYAPGHEEEGEVIYGEEEGHDTPDEDKDILSENDFYDDEPGDKEDLEEVESESHDSDDNSES